MHCSSGGRRFENNASSVCLFTDSTEQNSHYKFDRRAQSRLPVPSPSAPNLMLTLHYYFSQSQSWYVFVVISLSGSS
jgi:hypothetical protein